MKPRIPRKLKKRIKKACNITGSVGSVATGRKLLNGFVEYMNHQSKLTSLAYSLFDSEDDLIGNVGQKISFYES